jgi:transcriptional regulator with XRE-family HTH domain
MASDREDITAARKTLGAQLRAWREHAGLTQADLARRTGYHRTSIGAAERGEPRAAALFQAADRATGAGGALATAYAQTAADIAAIRTRAARAAREQAAGIAAPGGLDDAAVGVLDRRCPACDIPLDVTCYILVTLAARRAAPAGGS